jgi:hypothetical protein
MNSLQVNSGQDRPGDLPSTLNGRPDRIGIVLRGGTDPAQLDHGNAKLSRNALMSLRDAAAAVQVNVVIPG